MTRMTPAQFVAGNENATGGGAATPSSTSGVRMPTSLKEDMMHKSTPPRPWLDEATATHLTESDLARLDADYARWSADGDSPLGTDLVEYIRDCAADQARVRMIMGPDDVPLPDFATVHKFSEWELTETGTDAVRYVDAIYADVNDLTASLEADQYAVSTRLDTRVRIGEGITENPEELRRWALDLLALAGRWTEIREGKA